MDLNIELSHLGYATIPPPPPPSVLRSRPFNHQRYHREHKSVKVSEGIILSPFLL